MNILKDTPIEKYFFQRKVFFVKREDLSCLSPGPPFAKVRGLFPFLQKLKKQGIETVSYMDTEISMASWGLAYFAKRLEMKAVIFYPSYKNKELRFNQQYQINKWKEFDPEIIPLESPNRLQINFYRARKILLEKYPNAYMLPQGLPFEETKHEVSRQVSLLDQEYGSIVTVIGSGTMCSGILMGLEKQNMKSDVHGVFCSPKNFDNMRKKILSKAGFSDSEKGFNLLKKSPNFKLFLYNMGYEYTQREQCECPFPCNEFYDKKAFKWMVDNFENLNPPVLFWNIGSDFSFL